MKVRVFEDKPAVRERVPLMLGMVGPSGSGKTFSALRVATGIASVVSGKVFVIDTEARRALHYAPKPGQDPVPGVSFKFNHIPFGAPFSPLDYLAAIQHCANKGASVVVIDSMSHEHEGPGGVLEMHAEESERLSKQWKASLDRVNWPAWKKPKGERRRLINTVLQTPISLISCFRAKEKLKIEKGREPKQMGWMAIGGEDFIYEQAINYLLLPGANGVPTWNSKEPGEQKTIKLPGWAKDMMPAAGKPLDEATGERLARWAEGTVARSAEDLLADYTTCGDAASFGSLESERNGLWRTLSKNEKQTLKSASDVAKERLAQAEPLDFDPEAGELSPEEEARMTQEGMQE